MSVALDVLCRDLSRSSHGTTIATVVSIPGWLRNAVSSAILCRRLLLFESLAVADLSRIISLRVHCLWRAHGHHHGAHFGHASNECKGDIDAKSHDNVLVRAVSIGSAGTTVFGDEIRRLA